MTALLYAAVVLAWGFTWFATKLQLGPVAAEISICWRFLLAAALLWSVLFATGRARRVPLRRHLWLAAMGLCLFGLNFLLTYSAIEHVTSGVAAVVFTMVTVFNPLNLWIFHRRAPSARVLIGAALGILGTALLFGEELGRSRVSGGAAAGIALQLAGAYVFSLGNLASMRATAEGTDLPNAVARGMLWGAAFFALLALVRGRDFALDLSPGYLLSLAYLAVVGSAVGLLAYLSLVGRVGADRAAYATVLYPAVALAVSTLLEGYVWTPWALSGVPLVLLGSVVIFRRGRVDPT